MSARESSVDSPRHCSGDMYPKVPIVVPRTVTSRTPDEPGGAESSTPLTKPQSITTIRAPVSCRANIKFEGLISRWTKPRS